MRIFFSFFSRTSSKYLVTTIAGQGFSFIVSLFIWGTFSVDDLGLLVSLEIITLTISSVFGISSDQYIARNFFSYDDVERKKIVFNTWVINWGSALLTLLLAIIIISAIDIDRKSTIIYSVVGAGLTYFNQLPFTIMRYESRFANFLWHNFFSVFLKVIFVYFFVLIDGKGITSYYLGTVIIAILVFPWYFFYLLKRSVHIFDKKIAKRIVVFSLPIIPSTLLSNATPIISRIILQRFGSINLVAIFSIVTRLTSPLTSLQTALRIIFVPQIVEADNKEKGGPGLMSISKKFYIILLFFTFCCALFCDEMTRIFFKNTFAEIDGLYLFFIAAFFSNCYTYISIGIFLARKNNYFWIPISFQILVMIFPGIYLIQHYHVTGLVITELLRYFLYVVSGSVLSYRFYGYPSRMSVFLWPGMVAVVLLFIFDYLSGCMGYLYLLGLKLIVLFIIVKTLIKYNYFNKFSYAGN